MQRSWSIRRRRSNRLAAAAVCIAFALGGTSKAAVPSRPPSPAEIENLLAERIDFYRRGVGMVVGIIGPDGRHVVVHGVRDSNDSRLLTGDTQFEIGSITKAFVGLLLEDMARSKAVSLDEPINRLLPPSMKTPVQDGRPITLLDLATHTSGFPEEPANLDPADPNNPFATYSEAQFGAFASSFVYPWPIGSQMRYSNLGYGLLGYGLGRAGGSNLATLLQARVLRPLGMQDTYFDLPETLKSRLAPGHDPNLQPTEAWDHSPLFQGSGGLHSSANDLLTFLSAAMGLTDTPLAPDFQAMLAVKRAGPANIAAAIGWTVLERDGQDLVFKGGGTGGYRSCVAFDRAQRLGVVVLSNTGDPDVCDIAWRVLDPHSQLVSFDKPIALARGALEAVAGRYRSATGEVISITVTGDHLVWSAAATGSAQPMFAASRRLFFSKETQTKLAFDFEAEDQQTPRGVLVFRGKGPEVFTRVVATSANR